MSYKALTRTLLEVPKSLSAHPRALTKTCCISSLHSAAKPSRIEIDLRRKENKKLNIAKLIRPKLTDDIAEERSMTSFHITTSAVSWAKMSTASKDLLEWGVVDLPNEMHKIHIITIYEMVLQIVHLFPKADLYVMEEMRKPKLSSTDAVFINIYLLQFRAILLAYLNEFKVLNEESDVVCNNKVYFLRSRVAARLSSTLVGYENVSSEEIVMSILNQSSPQYSHINVDTALKQKYKSRTSSDKENMGRALLLIMAFRDLVVLKTPQSIEHMAR